MILKHILIENLLSISNIDLNLQDLGVTLLEGVNKSDPSLVANGAGKSAILGSVYYAIYGSFPDGTGADAVINRKVGKKSKAQLTFEKGGKEYVVTRSRKKNGVTLTVDGTDITTNSASETDKRILEVFGISEKLFTNAILFDSINSKRFATMGDKERKEMLVELLNLEVYTQAHTLAKAELKQNADLTITKQRDLSNAKVACDLIIQQEESEKSNLIQSQQRAQDAHKKLTDAQGELLEHERVNYTSGYYTGLETDVVSLKEALTKMVRPNVVDAYNEMMKHTNALTNANKTIQALTVEYQTLDAQRERYLQSDICPTCGNEMDTAHREMEINKILERYQGIKDTLDIQTATIATETPLNASAQAEYERVSVENDSFEFEYQQLQNKYNEAREKLDGILRGKSAIENNIAHLQATLSGLTSGAIQTDYKKMLSDKQEEYNNIQKQLIELAATKTDLELAVKTYSDTGVKSHVMDLTAPFINKRMNEYLTALTGGTIKVTLTTQKELTTGTKSDKIDLVVENTYGGSSYSSLSAGEKRRVDVSLSLALQDLVMTKSDLEINLLMYDEVFENLDEVGCENVAQLLKNRLKVASSILVVSHNESLKPLFNNVLTVVKENGSSTIEGK